MTRSVSSARTVAGIRSTSSNRYPPTFSGLYFNNDVNKSSGVSLSNVSVLQGLSALTIEAWVFITGYPLSANGKVFHYFSGNTGYQVSIGTTGNITLQVGNGTTSAGSNGTPAPSLSLWHKLEFCWDGALLYAFLDGVGVGTTVLSGGSTGNPGILPYIGNQAAGSRAFPGTISELRISNIARHTSNYTVQTSPVQVDVNTLALYRTLEGTGTSLVDSSVTINNGTLGGTPIPQWVLGRFTGNVSGRTLA